MSFIKILPIQTQKFKVIERPCRVCRLLLYSLGGLLYSSMNEYYDNWLLSVALLVVGFKTKTINSVLLL
jgi:hypothetical protein